MGPVRSALGAATLRRELGALVAWALGEWVAKATRPKGLVEVVAKLSATQGASLGQAGEQDLQGQEAVAVPVLERGGLFACDRGPSTGEGVTGLCLPRAPTDAERVANRGRFET